MNGFNSITDFCFKTISGLPSENISKLNSNLNSIALASIDYEVLVQKLKLNFID